MTGKPAKAAKINVRTTEAGKAHLEATADLEGVTPSELARRWLAYGAARMPKGWRP